VALMTCVIRLGWLRVKAFWEWAMLYRLLLLSFTCTYYEPNSLQIISSLPLTDSSPVTIYKLQRYGPLSSGSDGINGVHST